MMKYNSVIDIFAYSSLMGFCWNINKISQEYFDYPTNI